MVDAALNVAAEQIVEHSAYGALLERDGNRGPTAAPQNLYLTADADDAGRAAMPGSRSRSPPTTSGWRSATRSATRRGRWTRRWRPRPGGAAARRASTATCRAGAASGPATRSSTASGRAGVPVGEGDATPRAGRRLPQLQFRGFFEEVDRPRHRNGPPQHRCRSGSREGPTGSTAAPAPLLGEHTEEVLARPRGRRRRAGRARRPRRHRPRPRHRARPRVGFAECPTRSSTTRSKPRENAGSNRAGATPRPAWPRSCRSCGPSRSSSTGRPPSCARSD